MTINLEAFFRYYEGQPQQKEAVQILQDAMPESLLQDKCAWVRKYREAPPKPATTNPLPVPFFDQKDNGPEGWRQCQTSSIAMCLAYLKVPGIKDDVDYLRYVNKYGDTTLQSSHQQALNELKIPHRFRTDMTREDLMAEVDKGFPVAIGVLHHGPVSAPSGGGHYLVVRGYTETHALVHDPYGSIDLVNGGWSSQGIGCGKDEQYSWKNLIPRWDIGGGWGWCFS